MNQAMKGFVLFLLSSVSTKNPSNKGKYLRLNEARCIILKFFLRKRYKNSGKPTMTGTLMMEHMLSK